MLGNEDLPPPDPSTFYTTDAFAERAIEFISGNQDPAPFFLYLAFNAPHWPLNAKAADVEKFAGKYRVGWDVIRQQRFERQKQLGLFSPDLPLSPREEGVRPWDELSPEEKRNASYRMSVYAVQVYAMDYNIGKLVRYLQSTGKMDNTLIVFLSDNGACAEPYKELGGGKMSDINNPEAYGAISYGMGWANASDTPFRKYKIWTVIGQVRAGADTTPGRSENASSRAEDSAEKAKDNGAGTARGG